MIFEKKKIQSETLGEYLTSVRNNLTLSQEQVVKKTGIPLKFLNSLENGSFKILPADVYVFGFVKKLAELYSIDSAGLIEQYKKEKNIQKQLSVSAGILSTGWRKSFLKKFVITPKILTITIGVVFVVLSLSYIIWQVWSINRTPSLQIYQPLNNAIIKSSFVQIRGKTDPGITVEVNNQTIFVDSEGGFQTQLSLNPGPEAIVITAQNSFDKSINQTVNVVGVAENQSTTTIISTTTPLKLK